MKCPDCEGRIALGQQRCPDCGRNLQDIDVESLQKKAAVKKRRLVLSVSLSIVLAVGGLVTQNYIQDQREKREAQELVKQVLEEQKRQLAAEAAEKKRLEEEKNDYSWVPKGFDKFSVNYNLAYKTIGYDAADCYSNCWGFLIVSKHYCNSIRVEANIQRNGIVLDSGSDYASQIPAQTQVVMRITSSADLPWNAFVTEVTCT